MVSLVDLDPQNFELRLEVKKDLCRVPLLDEDHTTCVGTTIAATEAEAIHEALKKNVDLFAWTTSNTSGVNSNIISHRLSNYKEA